VYQRIVMMSSLTQGMNFNGRGADHDASPKAPGVGTNSLGTVPELIRFARPLEIVRKSRKGCVCESNLMYAEHDYSCDHWVCCFYFRRMGMISERKHGKFLSGV